MGKRLALKAALAGAGVMLAAGLSASPAAARVFVGFGFGVPFYPPPYYYAYPPPVVYAPPPVVYTPPPVVYAPPPAPTIAPQTASSWYYCDNPQGYYPYVNSCNSAWRQVPATPQPK
jgi:hypothetical protein